MTRKATITAEEYGRTQSEEQFQAAIVKLAGTLGWRHYHPWRSFHSVAGFPDLVLIRAGVLVVAELKIHPAGTKRGDPTADQVTWLREFAGVAGVQAFLWRPTDWPAIEAVLGAPRGRISDVQGVQL